MRKGSSLVKLDAYIVDNFFPFDGIGLLRIPKALRRRAFIANMGRGCASRFIE